MVNAPKAKIRLGNVSAAIWENEFEVKGKKIINQSVDFSKNYKTQDGEWKSVKSFNANDIPKLIWCAKKAYEKLYTTQKEVVSDWDKKISDNK